MNKFICKEYNSLTKDELYAILKIRQEVFILEQKCCYLDADSLDHCSQHLMLMENNIIIAYLRVIPKYKLYDEISFGRILVKNSHRKNGLGKDIVNHAINLYSNKNIIISAQLYLKRFYEEFGFCAFGDEFLEDEIPHIKMLKS